MMLSEVKITTKGQITLPVRVMRKLRIKPGDSIVFEQHGDHIEIAPLAQNFSIDDFIKKYSPRNKIKFSQAQMNQARKEFWGHRHKGQKKGRP